MANSKSYIREINLQNTSINLNKNKSIVSDFIGFNKNTGVWFNNVLSNLYNVDDKADGDIITINNDTFKIADGALYKNDILVKDYSNSNKVKTEILGNIDDNVIAYTPEVYVYYEGSNAYVRYSDTIVPVGTYYPNTIPYIVIDKEADTWCVMYGKYVVCKGMTYATVMSFTPTATIYSPIQNKWYCINNTSLINAQNTQDTINLNMTSNILTGAATVSGWTPRSVSVVQINSRQAFACITDLEVSNTPTVVLNEDVKTFQYLKGYIIQGTTATPQYSNEGDAIDTSVIADNFTLHTQAFNSWNKLASLQTKFLSYSSYLAIPYSTVAIDNTSSLIVSTSSLDGPTSYLFESLYTAENNEYVTLAGSTAGQSPNAASLTSWSEVAQRVEDINYPKLLGLFNSNFTPEWLHIGVEGFKLIYNRDALAGISKDGSIVVPWNDVDENSCTIYGDDIYYYSLNSNAWVHINVGTENDLKALKVGNYLILNSLTDNGYKEDSLFTYNIDTSLANFTIPKPRVGFINVYGILYTSYIVPSDASLYSLGNNWLTYMSNSLKNSAKTYYLSISRDELGPIWAATELINYSNVNTRKEGWQHTLTPSIENTTVDYNYYLNNLTFSESSATIDAYVSSSGSVLTYFKSWYDGIAKYNNKLSDTEKSMTEPTYYNLSPSTDIMTFIDGFNTIALVKVGNNTIQLLVKESELLLVYNLLSNVNNISDYFVLQGQQYGIINDYINKIDMVNGQIVAQTPITSVAGLKFLGNTDRQAFFFSQMNKTVLYFAADNILEFLMDATELDDKVTTVFAKQTNDIFLLLNDKVVVFTNSGSMFEIDERAEYITFGDNTWSDGNKTWSYYKTSDGQKRVPIQLESLWYGDTITRKLMNVDCVYIELYDDNYMPGKFEVSFDGLMNNTVTTKKQVFNVKEKDYDRVTKTVYLRYQPAYQNCAAFKININSELPIKRLAVGYTQEGIPLISKNNI